MSLKPERFTIPEETARVAKAAFPKGNPYMRLRDELGIIFEDAAFEGYFAERGQPAYSPARLALVLILQYAEGLSDRQVAEAVRARLDFKYVLGLELTDPGFDASVLSEFRTRLIEGEPSKQLLDKMLMLVTEKGLLKSKGKQRSDSTHIIASSHALNRLESIGETMRYALNQLAAVAPEWLTPHIKPEWIERYEKRLDNYRLPKSKEKREELALIISQDGFYLLEQIYHPESPSFLATLPAVEILRQLWLQQFYVEAEQPDSMKIQWREDKDLPPGKLRINSPYDAEARYSVKGQTTWTGYKVYLTEACDEDLPHLIVNVETSHATTNDVELTETIHQNLEQKKLLPQEHFLDSGFTTAGLMLKSQTLGIELIGPLKGAYSWQAKAQQGFDLPAFKIDWENKHVTCPEGKRSRKWQRMLNGRDKPVIMVEFDRKDCLACSQREHCTKAKVTGRMLTFKSSQQEHETMQLMREQQHGEAFQQRYKTRNGIEGTISQGVRSCDLRQSRYLGLAKTHLHNVLSALAVNVHRLANWFEGKALAPTRTARFAQLLA